MTRTILLVDDNVQLLNSWLVQLRRRGVASRILPASSADEALETARNNPIDLAVVDLYLDNGRSGLRVLGELRALSPTMRLLLVSDSLDCWAANEAGRLGAFCNVKLHKKICETVEAFEAGDDLRAMTARESPESRTLEASDRATCLIALHDENHNVTRAASVVGLERSGLQRKMKKLEIEPKRRKSSS